MNSNSNSTFTRGSIITMNNKEGGEDFIIVDVGTALGFMCVSFFLVILEATSFCFSFNPWLERT